MHRGFTSWLTGFLLAVSLWGQTPQGTQSPGANAQPEKPKPQAQQPQPPPLAVLLKKTVAFLTTEFRDGSQVKQLRGTAFFVFVEDKRLGENRGFVYLVTNRHMVDPVFHGRSVSPSRVSLRLNLRAASSGIQSAEATLPLVPQFRWYFSQDDGVDLAVVPLAPDQRIYDYEAFPASLFATKDVIESSGVAEGDAVLFAGFFYQFPGQKKIEPIVRQGILAMMPDEDIQTTRGKPGQLYLADVHVMHGNSGAPMFVNVGGFRGGNMIVGGFPYRLLGIVSGYFNETQDFHLEVATTIEGQFNGNSGISLVVPVDALRAILDSPALRAQRDAEVASQPR